MVTAQAAAAATRLLRASIQLRGRIPHVSCRNPPVRRNSYNPTSTFYPSRPTHLVFGANTDVGKTIVSAGLIRASLGSLERGDSAEYVHYIKPLQCGGFDQDFVDRHASAAIGSASDDDDDDGSGGSGDDVDMDMEGGFTPGLMCTTLFEWETPASPHVSSRREDAPASDGEVLAAVRETLNATGDAAATFVETAGGVLSPSSASPQNEEAWHSRFLCEPKREGGAPGDDTDSVSSSSRSSWGWSTQADLYAPPYSRLSLPVVLVGDGRLGGISVTLSSLEALEARGYAVHGIVLIDDGHFGSDNARALEEYVRSAAGRRERRRRARLASLGEEEFGAGAGRDRPVGVHLLPPLPPMPEPLDGWFVKEEVEETFQRVSSALGERWRQR